MSLFKCEQCDVIENTALCGMVFDDSRPISHQRVLICSECNPKIGTWHGHFPKVYYDDKKWELMPGSSRYVQRKSSD